MQLIKSIVFYYRVDYSSSGPSGQESKFKAHVGWAKRSVPTMEPYWSSEDLVLRKPKSSKNQYLREGYMRSKKLTLSNFSRTLYRENTCIRPDKEQQLVEYSNQKHSPNLLARGSGLSYNDSCFNTEGTVIDTQHLNHLISFDPKTGVAVCQGGVSFKDLFTLDPEFIPPVIPGTLHATLAGGIAHDIHGKNNPREHSLGHHLCWFTLLIGGKSIHCSREENSALFYASIAGLGLTGTITRAALRLKKASRWIQVEHQQIHSLGTLISSMSNQGLTYEYQVAWLDLLHKTPRALLSLGNHYPSTVLPEETKTYTIPKLPLSLIKQWNMKLFNHYFFHSKKARETLSIEEFNNPLDKITHWNYLYGAKGLIQFQAVFAQDKALIIIERLLELIKTHKAVPTLAVLKLFTQAGSGLLSFCKPGFTLAIDFIHNQAARQAILQMNLFITEQQGRVYLAKDLLLEPEHYRLMYEHHHEFSQILAEHQCTARSDLAKRLGIL